MCIGARNPSCTSAITAVNTNDECHAALQGNVDMGCEGNCRTLLHRVTDACSDEVKYQHSYYSYVATHASIIKYANT